MNSKDMRIKILNTIMEEGEGHLGGSLSCIDILIVLYDNILTKEDVFILSKGHAYTALYCVLKEKGFNPKKGAHPDIDTENGIYCTTGSLGHGLPVGIGVALSKKLKGEPGKVYVLISDGELEEGTTWESLLISSKYKLDNLVIVIDYNKFQAMECIEEITSIANIKDLYKKLDSFINNVFCVDGHNIKDLIDIFNINNKTNKPLVIISNTIKCNGISFMIDNPEWHGKVPNKEEYEKALKEISI